MALRLCLIFTLLALAMVVESSSLTYPSWGLTHFGHSPSGDGGIASCNGAVGDCIDEEEEMMMDSGVSRRALAQARKYISYGALKKNQVPCSKRGQSYYNCKKRGKANPYRRGCSHITRCGRYTNA